MAVPTNRPRLLFLTHRVPFPPDKGDRIRSWQLLKRMAKQYDVWLGCLADEPWNRETESILEELCVEAKIVPTDRLRMARGFVSLMMGDPITLGLFRSPALERWVRDITSQVDFDGLVVFCSNMAAYTRLNCVQNIPHLVDLVDVDSEKWREYATRSRFPLNQLYRWEAQSLQKVERELGCRAHAVILTTQAERDLYRRHAPAANSHVVRNGVATEYFCRPSTSVPRSRDLVFVGALDYRPNVEGALWFCEHVWPVIHRRNPAAVLRIVGRRPTPAVRQLARVPGVKVHADVPDVRPYLVGARIAVVPLHVARGVQNKVLEAMACETPVIASPAALRGLTLIPGEDALSADAPDEWIESIERLLGDDSACDRLAQSGRRFVEQHCLWPEQLKPLDDLIADMVDNPPYIHHARSALAAVTE